MADCCCVCKRRVTAEQDFLYLHSYPLICRGSEHVHLVCFRIRVSQAKNLMLGLEQNIHYLAAPGNLKSLPTSEQLTCGYCTREIDTGEDLVCYRRCGHGHVHLKCASLVDFVRRGGCVYCYSEDDDRRALHAWEGTTGRRSGDNLVAAETHKRVQSKDVVDMFNNGAVKDVMLTQQPVDALVNAFRYKRPYIREPVYPTLMRQLNFQINFDETADKDDKRVPNERQKGALALMLGIYQIDDLIKMGLTFPIILYSADNVAILTKSLLYSDRVPVRTWPFSFVSLLLAGLNLSYFYNNKYGIKDLCMIDFHVAALVAAGGSVDSAERIFEDIITSAPQMSLVSLLAQFGYTEDMKSIFAK